MGWRTDRLLRAAKMRLEHVAYRAGLMSKKDVERLREYWHDPSDDANQPERYAEHPDRSKFLIERIDELATRPSSILEVGCNVGRNLHFLREAGFAPLTGVELSGKALETLRRVYPGLADAVTLLHAPAEEALRPLAADSFDLVFSMAVLVHIPPPGSDEVFTQMARVARRNIVTIEDETLHTERHFPRDYERIFSRLGLRQIAVFDGATMAKRDFTTDYVARVFEKPAAR